MKIAKVHATRVFALAGYGLAVFACLEIAANTLLPHLAPDTFARFASVDQVIRLKKGHLQFSFQTGFGIYPAPNYSDAVNRHDRFGFRGEDVAIPKPDHIFRIACLGGSTTYDSPIPDWRSAYPLQLQKILRDSGWSVEVINAGSPSWTSREQILNYTVRVSWMQPDMIILYDGINDLLYRAVWPPEELRSDYTNPDALVPAFAQHPWYSGFTLFRIPLILTGRMLPPTWIDPFWCDLAKTRGAGNVFSTIPAFAQVLGSQATLPPGMTLIDVFKATPTAFYQENIAHIIRCAKAKGTRVMLVSFVLGVPQLRTMSTDGGESLLFGIGQMNAVMRDIARDQDVLFYDLAADMPDTAAYWRDIIHNSPAGATEKARLIANSITSAHIIPSKYRNSPSS